MAGVSSNLVFFTALVRSFRWMSFFVGGVDGNCRASELSPSSRLPSGPVGKSLSLLELPSGPVGTTMSPSSTPSLKFFSRGSLKPGLPSGIVGLMTSSFTAVPSTSSSSSSSSFTAVLSFLDSMTSSRISPLTAVLSSTSISSSLTVVPSSSLL